MKPRTALELQADEWGAYHPAQALRLRQEATRSQSARLYQRAMLLAKKAAALLRGQFGAVRVVVFGSLARPAEFSQWSDIDLAAWGIPADRYFSAVAGVTGLSAEFSIDLVDAETCAETLRRAIVQDGIDL